MDIEQALRERARSAPPCLLVTVPKAGTHLLIKLLQRLGYRIAGVPFPKLAREYRDSLKAGRGSAGVPKVNIHANTNFRQQVPVPAVEASLKQVHAGGFTFGHPYYSGALYRLLQDHRFRVVFLLRDPRAIARSKADWWVTRKDHRLRSAMASRPLGERLAIALEGRVQLGVPAIGEFVNEFLAWRGKAGVQLVRFEDVVGSQAGGSDDVQRRTIHQLATHLELELDTAEVEWVASELYGGTNTFNVGQIDRWRADFELQHDRAAKETLGDLLVELGYERDGNWPTGAAESNGTAGDEASTRVAWLPRNPDEVRILHHKAERQVLGTRDRLLLERVGLRVAQPPNEDAIRRDRVVFVHIPKTAGTSFMRFLRGFIAPEEVLPDDEIRAGIEQWTTRSRDCCRLFKGHFPYGAARALLGDAHYLCFLREPLDRVISEYFQWQDDRLPERQKRLLQERPHTMAKVVQANRLELPEWVRRQTTQGDCYLPNLQTWTLAGPQDVYEAGEPPADLDEAHLDDLLETAKAHLRKTFVFHGLTEEYARSLELFCYTFGLPGAFASSIERQNERPPSQRPQLDDESIQLLRMQNAHDLELYAYACELFEQRFAAMQSELLDLRVRDVLRHAGVGDVGDAAVAGDLVHGLHDEPEDRLPADELKRAS